MLDFYWLHESEDFAALDDCAARQLGGIDLVEHRWLAEVWSRAEACGVAVSYFDDTLLTLQQVVQLQGIVAAVQSELQQKSSLQHATPNLVLEKLKNILSGASDRSAKVVAICD